MNIIDEALKISATLVAIALGLSATARNIAEIKEIRRKRERGE